MAGKQPAMPLAETCVISVSARGTHVTIKKKTYLCRPKSIIDMLIVEVKDSESIDRALKKYKRKFERAGIIKELRKRKHFTKPSVKRRAEVLKAVYKQKMYGT